MSGSESRKTVNYEPFRFPAIESLSHCRPLQAAGVSQTAGVPTVPRRKQLLAASFVLASLAICTLTSSATAQTSIEGKYLTNIRQVTSGFVKAGEGYFSSDAKMIVYQAVRPEYPFYQIYTQPLAGGEPKLISTGRGRTTCAYFSPDGKHVLFASSHENPRLADVESKERKQQEEDRRTGRRRRYSWPFDPYSDIYVTDLDGNIEQKLTSEYGYDAEGAYSRDGQWIAYCHVHEPRGGDLKNGQEKQSDTAAEGETDGKRNPDIYVMRADGSDKRRITSAPGYDGGPFISPDGRWIVFRTDRKKAEYLQIHVIGIDGKNETVLTDSNAVNWGPYWHPTKPLIVWAGADHSNPRARPNYDLYLMSYRVADGEFVKGTVTRITDSIAADVLPVFSPNGQQLMWTSTRTKDHSSQLFIADFKEPK